MNYQDYAAGRVIISRKGMTSFPVRLASEIFQQCLEYRSLQSPVCIYDPCGGSAHLLTVLGFLHGKHIQSLLCSDVRSEVVSVANYNLALLSFTGLMKRASTLRNLITLYDKPSHHDALKSTLSLSRLLPQNVIQTQAFVADALTRTIAPSSVDLLITDVPYDNVVIWEGKATDPISQLLDIQYDTLREGSIVAITTLKDQKINHKHYERLKHITVGKRRTSFLRPR